MTVDGVSGKGAPSGNVTFTISPAPSGSRASLTDGRPNHAGGRAGTGRRRRTPSPPDARAGVTYSVSASFAPTGAGANTYNAATRWRRRTPTSPSTRQQPRPSAATTATYGGTNPVATATTGPGGGAATPRRQGTVTFVVKRPNGTAYTTSECHHRQSHRAPTATASYTLPNDIRRREAGRGHLFGHRELHAERESSRSTAHRGNGHDQRSQSAACRTPPPP